MAKQYYKELTRCGDCPNLIHPNGFYKCSATGNDVIISSVDVGCPLEELGMKMEVRREFFGEKCTIGKLFVDGKDIGVFTLEDKYRQIDGRPVAEWKINGETAIPKGTYKLIINMSNRFKCMMPLLLNVEGYEGVRIHSGNTDAATHGCLLVGMTWDGKSNFIGSSKVAFAKVMQILEGQKDITITVS